MRYIPTIGLEIHVELKTATKLFCDSRNDPDEKRPNWNVCPVCLAHPGTLPVLNEEAVRKLIAVGLALHCSINRETFFERKNYFYPDLPKGYQISQFQKPLCENGWLMANGKKIRIERIHLEEDAGRLQHSSDGSTTLVDYNRAGLPLMELVTKPDLSDAADVIAFAQELRLALRYLGASDADMEKGQMRVEVNISIRPEDTDTLGTKVEVKNINSINAAGRAVEYEIARQTEALDRGERIVQETRGWDENTGQTVSQRIKEGSADYRYFPEPDLPPLSLEEATVHEIERTLPELPWQRRERFTKEYELPEADVAVFTNNRTLGDYFEHVASELISFDKLSHLKRPGSEHQARLIKLAANYLITELQKLLTETTASLASTSITPEMFAEFVVRVFHQEVSSSGAQTLLRRMHETGLHPDQIIAEHDLAQVSDSGALGMHIDEVVAAHPQAVTDFQKGKEASLKFLIGKVMAISKGKANPQVVEELLRNKLQTQ